MADRRTSNLPAKDPVPQVTYQENPAKSYKLARIIDGWNKFTNNYFNSTDGMVLPFSFATPVQSTAANVTLDASDYLTLADCTSDSVACTLPTATGINGREYIIKKTDSSANPVNLTPNGSQLIDWNSTAALVALGESITIQAWSDNWYITNLKLTSL